MKKARIQGEEQKALEAFKRHVKKYYNSDKFLISIPWEDENGEAYTAQHVRNFTPNYLVKTLIHLMDASMSDEAKAEGNTAAGALREIADAIDALEGDHEEEALGLFKAVKEAGIETGDVDSMMEFIEDNHLDDSPAAKSALNLARSHYEKIFADEIKQWRKENLNWFQRITS